MKLRIPRKKVLSSQHMRITLIVKTAGMVASLPREELLDLADGVMPRRLHRVLNAKKLDFFTDFAAELVDGGPELRYAANRLLAGRIGAALWLLRSDGLPPAMGFLAGLIWSMKQRR